MSRDSQADASRSGPPAPREAFMYATDPTPMTLAEEAATDKAAGRTTVGTRGAADMRAME